MGLFNFLLLFIMALSRRSRSQKHRRSKRSQKTRRQRGGETPIRQKETPEQRKARIEAMFADADAYYGRTPGSETNSTVERNIRAAAKAARNAEAAAAARNA